MSHSTPTSDCRGPIQFGSGGRRAFLQTGLAGFATLSLPNILKLQSHSRAQGAGNSSAAKKAVIMVWQPGGMSHIDSYDPKPDSGSEYRGPFKLIPTKVPGLQFTELMPRQAAIADKLVVLRSMRQSAGGHPAGSMQLLSGDPDTRDKPKPRYPDWMTVSNYLLAQKGPRSNPLPAYVGINPPLEYNGPAYLGDSYSPFVVSGNPDAPTFSVPNIGLTDAEEVRLPKHRPDLVDYVDRAIRGGFPAVALQAMSAEMRDAWLDSYVAQLITRDAHELEPGRDSAKLGRYLQALAAHSATEIDHKTLYDAAGIDRRTAVAYDSLLESLFVVEQVQSWDANRLKRLTSTPKRYLVDPSMMAAVLGATAASVLNDGTLLGRTIDTFVTSQLRPEVTLLSRRSGRHHVRTKNGREEIDILIETPDGRLIALEVKATAGPSRADARHLAWLRDSIGDRFVAGAVLHTGPDVFSLGDRILAVPICAFWA